MFPRSAGSGAGVVLVGLVEQCVIEQGLVMVVRFPPSGLTIDGKSLQMHHEAFDEALPGDEVGFNVRMAQ